MKRALLFWLSAVIVAAFSGCGGSGGQSLQSAGSSAPEAEASVPEISLDGEITGEITVQSFDTMMYKSLLEDAAKLFEEKYPGTKVNVETFSAMPEVKTMETEDGGSMVAMFKEDDAQERQDYLNKVNTQFMSGGGADVLAIDVLPVNKLARGGQLENLSGYMEADSGFQRDDYRANVLDAAGTSGGTYFLPLNYSFDYYAYDSTLFSEEQAKALGNQSSYTFQELIEFTKQAFEEKNAGAAEPTRMFSAAGAQEVFSRLLEENYGAFVDEQGKAASFTDGEFAALLETVSQYRDAGYMKVAERSDRGEDMMLSFEKDVSARFFLKPQSDLSLLSQYNKDSGFKFATSGYGGGNEDDDEIAGIRADSEGNVPFSYTHAFGINANSGNKRTAWEFVKFLLSEEMQLNTNMMSGFPLHNEARAKKAELQFSGEFFGLEGAALNEQQEQNLALYKAAVEELSGRINAFGAADNAILDMIHGEAAYYFDGSKSAEEVAASLQSKVDLYLNE